jgi:hypothetical protein
MTATPKNYRLGEKDREELGAQIDAELDKMRAAPRKRRSAASPPPPPDPESIRPALAAMFQNAGCGDWSQILVDELVEMLKRRDYQNRMQARGRVNAAPLLTNLADPAAAGSASVTRIG